MRTLADRLRLVLQTRLVQPETLLRRHRQGFRPVWRAKSAALQRPQVSAEKRL